MPGSNDIRLVHALCTSRIQNSMEPNINHPGVLEERTEPVLERSRETIRTTQERVATHRREKPKLAIYTPDDAGSEHASGRGRDSQ
jgi:hypothetical protein